MPSSAPRVPVVGRYTLHGEIASGGMATVYYGRLDGPVGFRRIVAIKRLLPRFARSAEFLAMFADEARIASRVQHANVVATLDVLEEGSEIFIVMEYIRGPSLAALCASAAAEHVMVPVPIALHILGGLLAGLHAAHETRDSEGALLGIVHRDVSPQNVLVGVDGIARIMDFGVAKAQSQLHVTRDGVIKGKLAYMAPEQIERGTIDRGVDIFAAGAVLWGMLAGRRLFRGADIGETMTEVLRAEVPTLRDIRSDVPPEIDLALRTALQRDREKRYMTARDFQVALEAAGPTASPRAVGEWVQALSTQILERRDARVTAIERTFIVPPDPSAAPAVADPAANDAHEEHATSISMQTIAEETSMSGARTLRLENTPAVGPPSSGEAPFDREPKRPASRPTIPLIAAGAFIATIGLGAIAIRWSRAPARGVEPDANETAVAAAPRERAETVETATARSATPPSPSATPASAAAPSVESPATSARAQTPDAGAPARKAAKGAAPASRPQQPAGFPGYLPDNP